MPDTAAEQTRVLFGKIREVLSSAGTNEDAIVEMTSYHTDIDADFAPVQAVVEDVLSVPLPAWTAVEVQKLRRPGARVEFRIVVHHPVDEAT